MISTMHLNQCILNVFKSWQQKSEYFFPVDNLGIFSRKMGYRTRPFLFRSYLISGQWWVMGAYLSLRCYFYRNWSLLSIHFTVFLTLRPYIACILTQSGSCFILHQCLYTELLPTNLLAPLFRSIYNFKTDNSKRIKQAKMQQALCAT